MSFLVLGGTTEGRSLAMALHRKGLPVIYSLAGLVRETRMECEVIIGGFSRYGGLDAYIGQRGIRAVLDLTHPYAVRISQTAVSAARRHGIPCWRYQRTAWKPKAGDRWHWFHNELSLFNALADRRAVFITTGQPSLEMLEQLSAFPEQRQWLRTAVPPVHPLPETMTWLQGIGPFSLENERELLTAHRIDALVSKDSGGQATSAKLEAARELGIPVFLLERPKTPPATRVFNHLSHFEDAVLGAHWPDSSPSAVSDDINRVMNKNEESP